MEMSKELLAKAKEAKTPEELMAFAKENNMEMTEESAKAYILSSFIRKRAKSQMKNSIMFRAAAAITAAGLSFP